MSVESTLRAAFGGANAFDPGAIMACWNPDGTYDNPGVGPAATGFEAVRACMVKPCDGVRRRGQRVGLGSPRRPANRHGEPRPTCCVSNLNRWATQSMEPQMHTDPHRSETAIHSPSLIRVHLCASVVNFSSPRVQRGSRRCTTYAPVTCRPEDERWATRIPRSTRIHRRLTT
jgi:hypothetical protein